MSINLEGLIPIFGGVYALLMVYNVIPVKPEDKAKMDKWHKKFDPLLKVLAPLLIIFGIAQFFGAF